MRSMRDLRILQTIFENFVRFLKSQADITVSTETLTTSPKKYRTAGGFEGCIHMSEDFDEPLEDMKEYMY